MTLQQVEIYSDNTSIQSRWAHSCNTLRLALCSAGQRSNDNNQRSRTLDLYCFIGSFCNQTESRHKPEARLDWQLCFMTGQAAFTDKCLTWGIISHLTPVTCRQPGRTLLLAQCLLGKTLTPLLAQGWEDWRDGSLQLSLKTASAWLQWEEMLHLQALKFYTESIKRRWLH